MTQLERLSQKLDRAEKKIIEYAQLIASLYAEQKRYQDIVCNSCRENIYRANLATAPQAPPTSSGFSRSTLQPIPVASTILSGPTSAPQDPGEIVSTSIVWGPAAPPLPAPFLPAYQPVHSHLCESSLDINAQATVPPLVTATAAIPTYSTDADSVSPQPAVPSTPEKATKASPTKRDWSVEYNPKSKQTLNLHVSNTVTFTAAVLCAKFSCDGKYLAVGLANGEIHIHNMITGSKSILVERSAVVFYTEEAETPTEIRAVRFTLDNKYIATGGNKGQINIWEIGRKRVRASFKHKSLLRSLDFSPDGRFLVSASRDKSLCMWRVRDGSRRIISQGTSFVSVAFSPDGWSVAAGNDAGLLRIWDTRTDRLVAKCTIADPGRFNLRSMAFMPDGKGIASGNNILRCWDVSSLRSRRHAIKGDTTSQMTQIWEFNGHKGSITTVSFSSNNRWVISSSLDRNVCILDARTGSWLCTLKGHTGSIWGADFSPDGHYIVSGSIDRRVRLWRYEIVE